MLSLAASQGMVTQQVDFSNAFVQATLNEDIYILPQGFESHSDEEVVLKLNKFLNGLVQAPLYWGNHLQEELNKCGFHQSAHDQCLYYGHEIILLSYVDDCLFFGDSPMAINAIIADLKKDFALSREDNAFAFLGIKITRDG